jgi:hypothetical protein
VEHDYIILLPLENGLDQWYELSRCQNPEHVGHLIGNMLALSHLRSSEVKIRIVPKEKLWER